jgi:hypothetical protein
VTRLDERERRIALWAAGFGAVTSVVLYAPAFDDYAAAVVLALVGMVMAGLLALASRSGSRLLTCLAAGLLGIGPWGYAFIIGLPYFLLAGWLMFRDANARKEERAARPAKVRRAKEKKPPKEVPPKPTRPGTSKRYTPPAGRR